MRIPYYPILCHLVVQLVPHEVVSAVEEGDPFRHGFVFKEVELSREHELKRNIHVPGFKEYITMMRTHDVHAHCNDKKQGLTLTESTGSLESARPSRHTFRSRALLRRVEKIRVAVVERADRRCLDLCVIAWTNLKDLSAPNGAEYAEQATPIRPVAAPYVAACFHAGRSCTVVSSLRIANCKSLPISMAQLKAASPPCWLFYLVRTRYDG